MNLHTLTAHGEIPLNLDSWWFYLRNKLTPPFCKDLHILFISLSAVVKTFYRKVCRPYLAFFVKGKGTVFLVLTISEKRQWQGPAVEHQVAMFPRISLQELSAPRALSAHSGLLKGSTNGKRPEHFSHKLAWKSQTKKSDFTWRRVSMNLVLPRRERSGS